MPSVIPGLTRDRAKFETMRRAMGVFFISLLPGIAYELIAWIGAPLFGYSVKHDIGFGIFLHFTTIAMIPATIIAIALGELWWPGNWKRWIPHYILIIILIIWALNGWEYRPYRYSLFVFSALLTLPARMILDRWTRERLVRAGFGKA